MTVASTSSGSMYPPDDVEATETESSPMELDLANELHEEEFPSLMCR